MNKKASGRIFLQAESSEEKHFPAEGLAWAKAALMSDLCKENIPGDLAQVPQQERGRVPCSQRSHTSKGLGA